MKRYRIVEHTCNSTKAYGGTSIFYSVQERWLWMWWDCYNYKNGGRADIWPVFGTVKAAEQWIVRRTAGDSYTIIKEIVT